MSEPRTFQLKRLLDLNGPMRLRHIAERQQCTRKQAYRALENLELHGLVVSRGSPRTRLYQSAQ